MGEIRETNGIGGDIGDQTIVGGDTLEREKAHQNAAVENRILGAKAAIAAVTKLEGLKPLLDGLIKLAQTEEEKQAIRLAILERHETLMNKYKALIEEKVRNKASGIKTIEELDKSEQELNRNFALQSEVSKEIVKRVVGERRRELTKEERNAAAWRWLNSVDPATLVYQLYLDDTNRPVGKTGNTDYERHFTNAKDKSAFLERTEQIRKNYEFNEKYATQDLDVEDSAILEKGMQGQKEEKEKEKEKEKMILEYEKIREGNIDTWEFEKARKKRLQEEKALAKEQAEARSEAMREEVAQRIAARQTRRPSRWKKWVAAAATLFGFSKPLDVPKNVTPTDVEKESTMTVENEPTKNAPEVVAEVPEITPAEQREFKMVIQKGSNIWETAKELVPDNDKFLLAWTNPESTGFVNGEEVPIYRINLVHPGDTLVWNEKENTLTLETTSGIPAGLRVPN